MNKKFLSAILFGALMVTSTGTFVSCKDYDDDITNLQEQVNADKSALSTLTTQAATLQSALTTAQSTADAAKTAAAEAKKAGDDALAKAKEAEAAAAQAKADAIKDAADKVAALKTWVETQGYATKAELAVAIAAVDGKIEGIEAGLSELTDYAKGLEEQLNTLNLTALSNIAALQEDLELQKKAIEALQNSTTDGTAELADLIEAIKTIENNYGQVAGNLEARLNDLDETLAAKFESQDAFINQLSQVANTLVQDVDTNKSQIDELWAEINGEGAGSIRTQMGQLAGMISEIQAGVATLHTMLGDMVTSVALWAPQTYGVRTMALYNVVEKAAVFGDKTAIKANENITFTEGKLVSYDDFLTIRVSPTNAKVTKEQISLINSLGENLNEYLEVVEVKPYDDLLLGNSWSYNDNASRAAENKSGLWNVYFKLKEGVDPVKFAEEVASKKNQYGNNYRFIRFAVAVKNAETKGNVISGYNVEVSNPTAESYNELDFYANDKHVTNIRNRFYATDNGTWTGEIEELWWDVNNEEIEVPAVTPILKGDDKNVLLKDEHRFDNRTGYQLLPVVKGEPIAININSYKDQDGNWQVRYNGKIAGFYVTLDKEYAAESAPSEINAWNSYEYVNVGTDKQTATMFKGNSGEIVIKDLNNVSGDIIGFRVYAVNLDGTLVDPDGRAFYVAVGDAAAETQTIKATIAPKSQDDRTVYVELTDAQKTAIRALYEKLYKEGGSIDPMTFDESNPDVAGNKFGYDVEYVKDAEGTAISSADDINFVKIELWNNAQWYLDNGTYKAKQTFKNLTNHITGEVAFELTKVLPTEFPAGFSAKDQQIINGLYTCFLQPTTESWAVGETPATVGYMDLGSVFNGLIDKDAALIDGNYEFEFATSAFDGEELVKNTVKASEPVDYYQLQITPAVDFIEAAEEHATKVVYFYRGISSYKKADGTWAIGEDHKVTWGTQFNTKYACWHSVSTWSVVKAANNVITYAATEKTVDLANIKGVNTYNNTLFGEGADKKQTLKDLVEKNFLKINDAYLTSKATGEEEYFDITVEGNVLTFVPMKDDVQSNPVAAVASTLTIVCEDCFGCEVKIAVDYTVNKQ